MQPLDLLSESRNQEVSNLLFAKRMNGLLILGEKLGIERQTFVNGAVSILSDEKLMPLFNTLYELESIDLEDLYNSSKFDQDFVGLIPKQYYKIVKPVLRLLTGLPEYVVDSMLKAEIVNVLLSEFLFAVINGKDSLLRTKGMGVSVVSVEEQASYIAIWIGREHLTKEHTPEL